MLDLARSLYLSCLSKNLGTITDTNQFDSHVIISNLSQCFDLNNVFIYLQDWSSVAIYACSQLCHINFRTVYAFTIHMPDLECSIENFIFTLDHILGLLLWLFQCINHKSALFFATKNADVYGHNHVLWKSAENESADCTVDISLYAFLFLINH